MTDRRGISLNVKGPLCSVLFYFSFSGGLIFCFPPGEGKTPVGWDRLAVFSSCVPWV